MTNITDYTPMLSCLVGISPITITSCHMQTYPLGNLQNETKWKYMKGNEGNERTWKQWKEMNGNEKTKEIKKMKEHEKKWKETKGTENNWNRRTWKKIKNK